jgi:hypothetical protein
VQTQQKLETLDEVIERCALGCEMGAVSEVLMMDSKAMNNGFQQQTENPARS